MLQCDVVVLAWLWPGSTCIFISAAWSLTQSTNAAEQDVVQKQTGRDWLTDWLAVCAFPYACVCACSSFSPSPSEAEWKGSQIKAVYFLMREEKKENELHYSVLLFRLLLSPRPPTSSSECQAHEWLGGRRMGGTVFSFFFFFFFCEPPSVSVPWAGSWRSPGVGFCFHTR